MVRESAGPTLTKTLVSKGLSLAACQEKANDP